MNKHQSVSLPITAVINNANVIDLNDQGSHLERRWPIAWTILLVLVLSTGLWGAILIGARAAFTFLAQI